MSRWRRFADVLDEMVQAVEPAPASVRPSVWPSVAQGTPLYHFTTPHLEPNRFWNAPGPYAARPEPTPPPQESRRVHALTSAQGEALKTLARLGATLTTDFTARELRTAFRSLAQQYHPDRHPHASDSEKAQLNASFVALTSAYETLASVTAH